MHIIACFLGWLPATSGYQHTLLMCSQQIISKHTVRLQGGVGSVLPVSVQDCEVACEMAQPQCTSFSYNPVLTACFLKQGGARATCASPTTPCYEANQNLQVLPTPQSLPRLRLCAVCRISPSYVLLIPGHLASLHNNACSRCLLSPSYRSALSCRPDPICGLCAGADVFLRFLADLLPAGLFFSQRPVESSLRVLWAILSNTISSPNTLTITLAFSRIGR